MPGRPIETATFLFSDIEGSTKLWERYPEAMFTALAQHDDIVRRTIEQHDGVVFKTVGDGFCAAFAVATDAVAAALDVQRALQVEDWGEVGPIKVRVALHTGEAERRHDDYFGPPLNRIARLLSAGHGGQVLLSLATVELARDALPAFAELRYLGEHHLRDLFRPERVYQLLHPGLPAEFPALRSLDAFSNNLPVHLTSFVGRERELEDLKGLLKTTRLLTISGIGGAGKTRLALQLAADLLDDYVDGVWFVDLAPLNDPELLPQVTATTLGAREEAGRPVTETLAEYLRSKHMLVVLDNTEHLVSACANLANTLLRTCAKLSILSTGREVLGIRGEVNWRMPFLSVPRPGHVALPESLGQYEAVRLFVDRALLVQPSFSVTNENAPAVAQICWRLDGIPLAIELAAARVNVLTVEQIAARMDDQLRLLSRGSRVAPLRQQTLKAVVDWSYDLLSAEEQILFTRLAVFSGGWTLPAAEAVCGHDALASEDVLDLLAQLADKSLVVTEWREATTRYRLLETIRQYGVDKLRQAGDEERVRGLHLGFFLSQAEEADQALAAQVDDQWIARLDEEHDNLRAALRWSLDKGQIETGMRLAGALWRFWEVRGHLSEGRHWLDGALRTGGSPAARAKACTGAGTMAWWQADFERAKAWHAEALALYRALEDRRGIAFALNNLGCQSVMQGDYAQAAAVLEESLAAARATQDERVIIYALNNLGDVARVQGDYARAAELYREAVSLSQQLGDRWCEAISLNTLGVVARCQGDCRQAVALHLQVLALLQATGDRLRIAECLEGLAAAARTQEQDRRAAKLFGAAAAIREATKAPMWPHDQLMYQGEITAARAQVGNETFEALWAEGLAMSLEQAIAYGFKAYDD